MKTSKRKVRRGNASARRAWAKTLRGLGCPPYFIAGWLGVSLPTVYRYLRYQDEGEGDKGETNGKGKSSKRK
jgi:predicted transcriptional regulator